MRDASRWTNNRTTFGGDASATQPVADDADSPDVRRIIWALALGAASWAWAGPVGAAASGVVSPPPFIAANCSQDVSQAMQHWLNGLSPHADVVVPAGSCYLVDEGIRLAAPDGLTITGGTWYDATVPQSGASPKDMGPVFWMIGGSNVTLANMHITGVNTGGYDPSGAFAAAIRSDGVVGLNISNISVHDVYGDGIELTPLRAQYDLSGTIINPTENATISNVSVNGAGRQGVTLASVNGATLTSISLSNIGINAFDLEADQWDEGAQNVTINGCTVGGDLGGLFFANGGLSAGGAWTGGVTVEGCTMTSPQAGDAILVQDPSSKDSPRGPFTFSGDSLLCGSSVYVACVQSTNGKVSVMSSSLQMPAGTIHESVYHATVNSSLVFSRDTVSRFGSVGTTDLTSTVSVAGGAWTPFGAGQTNTARNTSATPAGSNALLVAQSTPVQPGTTSNSANAVVAAASPKTHRTTSTTGATSLSSATVQVQPHAGRTIVFALLLLCCGYLLLLARRRRGDPRRSHQTAPASALDLLVPSSGEGGVTKPPCRPN